jgi:hypothetical protein
MIILQTADKIILEICKMNTSNTSTNSGKEPDSNQMIRKDIKAKWDKFSDQDLMALQNRDDLVSQVVAKYGLEKPQVQRDVDALLKGREFSRKA